MSVKEIPNDEAFQPELASHGSKLIVVDFYATWCGPCKAIAPKIAEFAVKYPHVVFLKVDVDKCKVWNLAGRGGFRQVAQMFENVR